MWRVLAVSVLALGCVRRDPPPATVSREALTLGVWAEKQPEASSVPPPDALVSALVTALESRGFEVARPAAREARFDRLVEVRLEQLAATGAPWQLLVDVAARSHSQIGGRYRWNVGVVATLAGRHRVQERFEIPVALEFEHERAPDAIAAASNEIARRMSGLTSEALGFMPAPSDAGIPAAPP